AVYITRDQEKKHARGRTSNIRLGFDSPSSNRSSQHPSAAKVTNNHNNNHNTTSRPVTQHDADGSEQIHSSHEKHHGNYSRPTAATDLLLPVGPKRRARRKKRWLRTTPTTLRHPSG
ncbi:unnamed protein product, partial [Ectocarpus sp. 12 AP-2014]